MKPTQLSMVQLGEHPIFQTASTEATRKQSLLGDVLLMHCLGTESLGREEHPLLGTFNVLLLLLWEFVLSSLTDS